MSREFKIDGKIVNDQSDCYVIAEIGHNHMGDVEVCKKLIKAAHECGADAVKLQKRDNKALFTTAAYNKPYENENSYGATYGEHREYLEFDWDKYVECRNYSRELGITFFSTAFDMNSVDFLEKLEVPAYKVASGDLKSIPLLKYMAETKKPMVISTGGGTMEDVIRAYEAVYPINPNICFLQCTAGYPPAFEELDLKVIQTYRDQMPNTVVGLSSHDNGIAMALVAFVLGGRVVEKHFTLNHTWKGTDHAFSLEPIGMSKMIRDLRRARAAMGDGIKKQWPSEKAPLTKMGKKLVAAKDLTEGHVLTKEDFDMRSPGDGLAPYHMYNFIGKTLKTKLNKEEDFKIEQIAGL